MKEESEKLLIGLQQKNNILGKELELVEAAYSHVSSEAKYGRKKLKGISDGASLQLRGQLSDLRAKVQQMQQKY